MYLAACHYAEQMMAIPNSGRTHRVDLGVTLTPHLSAERPHCSSDPPNISVYRLPLHNMGSLGPGCSGSSTKTTIMQGGAVQCSSVSYLLLCL